MADALIAALNAINIEPRVIENGREIGEYAATVIDYTRNYVYNEADSSVLMCIKLCTYAEAHHNTVLNQATYQHINALFGLTPVYEANATDAAKKVVSLALVPEAESAILVVGLKVLRAGSNENKKILDFNVSIPTPAAALGKAYSLWSSSTANRNKKAVVQSIYTTFANCGQIPLQLAAKRLCGRGFTSCLIFVSLVESVQTDEGREALARVAGSYSTELTALVNLVTWLAGDPDRYNYGYYEGIPENHGAKKYAHLAALAIKCLPATTLKGYAGAARHVQFPATMNDLIETIKQSCLHVELIEYDASWLNLLTILNTRVQAVTAEPVAAGDPA